METAREKWKRRRDSRKSAGEALAFLKALATAYANANIRGPNQYFRLVDAIECALEFAYSPIIESCPVAQRFATTKEQRDTGATHVVYFNATE